MSATKRLNPLDWTFLAAERGASMMHVGALLEFSPPPKASADTLLKVMDELRAEAAVQPPWCLKLRYPGTIAHPLQHWIEDTAFDVDFHIRRSALPAPGGERELGVLVSRLHSNPVDFHHPPWEAHFIEGLSGGRFALYFKVHHALVDGYTGIRLLSSSLAHSAQDRETPMFFTRSPASRPGGGGGGTAATLERLLKAVRDQIDATRHIGQALKQVLRPGRDEAVIAPLQAPKSILNRPIGRNRRFATQQFPVTRLKQVAKAYGGTLNDVVLLLTGSALRRLLRELAALPSRPLTAMVPVNIRPKDDPGGGNAVGAILASLATDVADPRRRFEHIIASTQQAKAQLQGMTRSAIMQYSALLMSPLLLTQIPGAAGRLRPAFNVVISNVPGPTEPLYFRGFALDAYFPVSIPFQGYALNITVVSYIDTLNFGFIGCRDALPHLQRLAVYAREALEEIEATLPQPVAPTPKAAPKKAPSKTIKKKAAGKRSTGGGAGAARRAPRRRRAAPKSR